jgi:hypothetical protein
MNETIGFLYIKFQNGKRNFQIKMLHSTNENFK